MTLVGYIYTGGGAMQYEEALRAYDKYAHTDKAGYSKGARVKCGVNFP